MGDPLVSGRSGTLRAVTLERRSSARSASIRPSSGSPSPSRSDFVWRNDVTSSCLCEPYEEGATTAGPRGARPLDSRRAASFFLVASPQRAGQGTPPDAARRSRSRRHRAQSRIAWSCSTPTATTAAGSRHCRLEARVDGRGARPRAGSARRDDHTPSGVQRHDLRPSRRIVIRRAVESTTTISALCADGSLPRELTWPTASGREASRPRLPRRSERGHAGDRVPRLLRATGRGLAAWAARFTHARLGALRQRTSAGASWR